MTVTGIRSKRGAGCGALGLSGQDDAGFQEGYNLKNKGLESLSHLHLLF